MAKILVAYTTNSGSTEEVARAVAEELRNCGAAVDLRRVEETSSVQGYDAVVIGGPMILGWSRAAVNFVRRQRQALQGIPTAYFFTALSLTRQEDREQPAFPVFIDPYLCEPPKHPPRLSLKERYATLANYLKPALSAAPAVTPVSAAFFGGKMEMYRLKFWQAAFVMLVIGAQPGDRRNWDAIRQWSAQVFPLLAAVGKTATGSAR